MKLSEFFIIFFSLWLSNSMYPMCLFKNAEPEVRFKLFNVGQGLCIGVIYKDNTQLIGLLYDAGSSCIPGITVKEKNTFKEHKIAEIVHYFALARRIMIVISHADSDHYNWIPAIAQMLRDKQLSLLLGGKIADYLDKPSKKAAKEKPISAEIAALWKLKEELGGKCIEECTVDDMPLFLPPFCTCLSALIDGIKADTNNRSIVLKIAWLNILLTGDITGVRTKKLLKHPLLSALLPSATSVASHHGAASKSANDIDFLRQVNCSSVLVSAGLRADYQHPRGKFIERVLTARVAEMAVPVHNITFFADTLPRTARLLPYLKFTSPPTTNSNKKRYSKWVAVTNYALINTTDVGDIEINTTQVQPIFCHGGFCSLKEQMLYTLETCNLEDVIALDLTGSDFTVEDFCRLRLPLNLKTLIVSNCTIIMQVIKPLFALIAAHLSSWRDRTELARELKPQVLFALETENSGYGAPDFEKEKLATDNNASYVTCYAADQADTVKSVIFIIF